MQVPERGSVAALSSLLPPFLPPSHFPPSLSFPPLLSSLLPARRELRDGLRTRPRYPGVGDGTRRNTEEEEEEEEESLFRG